MNHPTWVQRMPFGGYPGGRAPGPVPMPLGFAPAPPHPSMYVGQYAPMSPAGGEEMRPIATVLGLAAVSFALFGGLGALAGYLVGHTTKSAVVGAALGLAALQGSAALKRG